MKCILYFHNTFPFFFLPDKIVSRNLTKSYQTKPPRHATPHHTNLQQCSYVGVEEKGKEYKFPFLSFVLLSNFFLKQSFNEGYLERRKDVRICT